MKFLNSPSTTICFYSVFPLWNYQLIGCVYVTFYFSVNNISVFHLIIITHAFFWYLSHFIDAINLRYCPRCKEQRQASKKLDLWRLPEVLVIHLKRFSFSRSTKHKLETFINFPIHDLDLTNYVANKKSPQCQIYQLYALINHYGSMASGHYTSHIKVRFHKFFIEFLLDLFLHWIINLFPALFS